MTEIHFPEYRDQNTASRYPFGDKATLFATTGLEIPSDLFIDANLYPTITGAPIYITQIDVSPGNIRIYIGTARTPKACWTDFDPLAPSARLRLVDVYGRSAGLLLVDTDAALVTQAWDIGSHTFRAVATDFVASCCRPFSPVGVTGLLTAANALVSNEVDIVTEDGVLIRLEDDHLRMDVVGDPLFLRKLCVPEELFRTPQYLQTINNIRSDEYGNMTIIAGGLERPDSIVRIYSDGDNTLTIELAGKRLAD